MNYTDKGIEDTSPLSKEAKLYLLKELLIRLVLTALVCTLRSQLGRTGFDLGILLRVLVQGGAPIHVSRSDRIL